MLKSFFEYSDLPEVYKIRDTLFQKSFDSRVKILVTLIKRFTKQKPLLNILSNTQLRIKSRFLRIHNL